MGLLRGAVRHYCLGGFSALVVCARRSQPVRGPRAGTWSRVFPVSPFPPRASCAVCGETSRPGVPYPRSLVRPSMRSLRSAGSVCLPFWYSPRVICVCLCAPAPAASVVWHVHLARSRCWALVGPFHAVRAPVRVLPRSRAPFGLLGGGGAAQSLFPFTWRGAVRSPWGGSARLGRSSAGGCGGGWGGGLCAVPPNCAAGGASGAGGRLASVRPSAFPGQASKRVSLASLWQWGAWPPYRSGQCSLAVPRRGPCGALECWREFACSSWFLREQAAGAWERVLLRPPSRAPRSCRGEGGSTPLPRGGSGPAPPWLAGRWGGVVGQGGGSRRGPPALSLGGAACGSLPGPPFLAGAFPHGVHARSGWRGSPMRRLRPAAGRLAWRGGGAAGEPPPRPVPLPSLSGRHCGRHWRCSGHGGRGPHTAPVHRRVPPPGVAGASF